MALAAGVAVTLAAAIPATGAFGVSIQHCQKYKGALGTADSIILATNSGQSSNVAGYLGNTAGSSKCS